MSNYFILCTMIQYFYFCCYSDCFSFGHWKFFRSVPCPLDVSCRFVSMSLQGAAGSPCVFPAPALEPVTSARREGLFLKMILRN